MTILAAKEIASRAFARDWAAVKARLGVVAAPEARDRIWLHAASNGELASARPVIERLIAEGRHLLITVNTDSALALGEGWGLAQTHVRLAPVDLVGPTRRVIRNWSIGAHITLESDLWPQRVLLTPGPVVVLGGRLTERSAAGWARFDTLVRRVLGRVRYLSAQDDGSAERFVQLGLDPEALGPVVDLKALYVAPEAKPDSELRRVFQRENTWLAASTHEGDEEGVLAAHTLALLQRPSLKLVLAPRHPRRADAIADRVAAAGLTCARRSRGEDPADAQVYLVDTLGEMHLWYALSGITFVAGSWSDRGGHTPYEPAAFGCAIVHGPDTANFRAAYDRLATDNAARCVADGDALAGALIALAPADRQAGMGAAAQRALRQETDLEGLMREVARVLDA
jgi:3-deoxy-D-manno-octulosonic-acid transferase